MAQGYDALKSYLTSVDSFPVRDYIGYRTTSPAFSARAVAAS